MLRNLILAVVLTWPSLLFAQIFTKNYVEPTVTEWTYSSNRCGVEEGDFLTEQEAVTDGANKYYEKGCGWNVDNPRRWGTKDDPTYGACGSTKRYPKFPKNLRDIQSSNTRHYSIQYMHGDDCQYTATDGLTVYRRRSVSCPEGYQRDGHGLCLTDQDTARQLGGCNVQSGDCFAGNPIHIPTGNKFHSENDYFSRGAHRLSFDRYYNSSSSVTRGSLGAHWRSSWDKSIAFLEDSELQIGQAYRGDGKIYTYVKTTDTWLSSADVPYELTETQGGYELTNGKIKEVYDSSGRLLEIVESSGYEQVLSYQAGQVSSVTDSYGRTLSLIYSSGLLESVVIPSGDSVLYSYDDMNRLISVQGPDDQATRQYLYENDDYPMALTGILDRNGDRYATWVYSEDGKAIESYHGDTIQANLTRVIDEGLNRYKVTGPLGAWRRVEYRKVNGIWKSKSTYKYECGGCSYDERSFIFYNDDGFYESITDGRGVEVFYERNADGRPIVTREAKGENIERVTTREWSSDLDQITAVETGNRKVSYGYDQAGNRISESVKDLSTGQSRATSWTYNQYGQVLSVDPPGHGLSDVVSYVYDSSGNMTEVENALGTVQFTAHDPNGNPLTMYSVNGVQTDISYDASQRVTEVVEAAGSPHAATTTFDYDAVGQLTRLTLPNGAWIGYEYDAAHRLTALEDALGNRVEYTLDTAGNRIAEAVSGSSGTVFRERTSDYDQLSRLVAEINGVGDRTEHDYDAVGNRSTTEDAASNVTAYAYDALNRLTEVTDALNGETAYEYDALDNLTQVIDPRGVMTTYDHNAFGDVLAEHSPDAGTTTYTYDAAGNRLTRTDARGVTATYSYDALNRLTGIDYPGNEEDIQYTYDQGAYGKGRLTGFTDAGGATTLIYDPRGNVLTRTRSTGGNSFTMQYEYDLADNITAIVYPSGLRIDLTRDTMGRITAVDTTVNGAATGLASQIQYQPFGGITGLTYGNGMIQTRQHDLAGRLVAQTVPPVQDLGWTYSNTGNITGIQDQVTPARTQTFSYDALDRLTDASGAYGTRAYQYDAVGNRTQRTGDGQTTPYGYAPDSNRLTTIDGQNVPYDATGNILTLAGDDFTYGARNRRQTTERNGTLIAAYEYNALGQRTHKSHAGTETHFVHGRNGQLIGEYDASGQVIREYVYLEGEPLAMIHQGAVYYFHNDQLGSPLKLTDSNQNVAWDGVRAPFGEMSVTTNAVENPLRFPGQYFDAETGLHQNWFRDYDPGIGRYTRSDPIGLYGGLNTYAYVGGNPFLRSDPMGLACGTGLCIGGALWVAGQLAIDATAVGAGIWVASENGQGDNLDDLLDDARDDLDEENFCYPENTPGDGCEELYATDTATCNGITRIRGKRSGAICHSSASERYAACLAGRPIPPLNTWNN